MGGLGLFRFKLLDFEPLALGVVFDSMEDGVIIIDKRFRLANFNPAASKIFAEINTSKLATNLEPWIRKWVGDETTLLCREPKSMDITLFEGKKHYYLKASPVFENQDRLAGWTLIFSDITIRIENEEKLKENARELAELIATKDKFMAIVAHDLRNPFTLLITLTDILVDNIEEKKYDTAIKDAKILRDTSRNTYQLLQNLLMWSQIQRNGIKFIPNEIVLKPIAENELEPIHLLAQQKKIQIITQIQDDIKVFADEQMLRTILRNILTNAVKYSFADKQVILTSSTIEEGVLIEIKDSGVGLSQEDINKLFKIETSFSKSGTAREKGTGLGLLLCQEFISLHQGKIWVESELGKGSTFKIMFPFKATNG
jgi:signal transduction histidine kinase